VRLSGAGPSPAPSRGSLDGSTQYLERTSEAAFSPGSRAWSVAAWVRRGPGANAPALYGSGLASVPQAPAAALAIDRIAPNPVRSSHVHVAFVAPGGAPVRVTLLDLLGRRVAGSPNANSAAMWPEGRS
jgi:hypothetical protein